MSENRGLWAEDGRVIDIPAGADPDEYLLEILAAARAELDFSSGLIDGLAGACVLIEERSQVGGVHYPQLQTFLMIRFRRNASYREWSEVGSILDRTIGPNRVTPTDRGPKTVTPSPTPPTDLPRLWSVLPRLLPRTVRARIYEPAELELAEELLAARAARPGRLVTVAFSLRGAGLVARVGAGALREKARKAVLALVTRAVGERECRTLRAWWAIVRGRLP